MAVFALLSTFAFAIPNSLTLQGKLTNTGGASQVGTFNFTFAIYDNVTSGNRLWEMANYSITTDANGVYDVILGNINLSFADQYYLGITVRTDNESSPRINLTSSPYAFRANVSEALNPNQSYTVTNLSVTGNATIGRDTTTVLKIDGILNTTSNTIIGDASTDTIAINAQFTTNLIPNQNNVDLGSATNFWRRAYIDLATIGNLSASGTDLGGTTSPTFVFNSNYSGDDARNVELIFERGTPTTNAVIFWDSTNKRFDMNFPLFIQDAQNLTVDTNTLFVDGSINKVGIGKTNPATELDVAGGINSSTLNVSGNVYLATLSGNVGIGTTSPSARLVVMGNLSVNNTDGTSRLFVDTSTGNVGIGTAAPGAKLDIRSTDAKGLIVNRTTDANSDMSFTNSAGEEWIVGMEGGLDQFRIADGANIDVNPRLTIDSSGNVGIGTTSPGSLLHLSSATPEIRLNDTDNPNWWQVGAVGDDFKIALNDSTTDVLYIDQDGNVGIGTASPQSKLDVRGNVWLTGTNALVLGGTNEGNYAAYTSISGMDGQNDMTFRTYRNYLFETDTGDGVAGTNRLTIKGISGNVGIGTTSPSEKLDVRGNIRLASNLTSTNFNINETSSAIVFSATGSKSLVFTTDASLWVG